MSVLIGAVNQRHQSRYFSGIGKGGLKLFVLLLLRIEHIQGGSNIVAAGNVSLSTRRKTACLTAGTCCLLPVPLICAIVKRCYFDWQTNLKCEHPRDAESDTSEYDSILPEGVSSHDLRGEPLWLLKLAGWIRNSRRCRRGSQSNASSTDKS